MKLTKTIALKNREIVKGDVHYDIKMKFEKDLSINEYKGECKMEFEISENSKNEESLFFSFRHFNEIFSAEVNNKPFNINKEDHIHRIEVSLLEKNQKNEIKISFSKSFSNTNFGFCRCLHDG